ncbi:hypothetical protein [Agromyces sp. GXQ0307]|uniref:hypothetical protein n=1 Tax=Agromyces sp. GXQ0307 TaxID=3377835 RepID=UPI00383BA389
MDTVMMGWRRAGIVALGAAWVPVAIAETLLMDGLDALDDVAVIAANSDRIATAGLLHVLGGVLLVAGLAAVAAPALRTVVGRIGWLLCALVAPCIGAFGMLHLLAVEVASDRLDAAAMQEFLVERLGGVGPWTVPVMIAAFLGAPAVALLVAGLARFRIASWWAFAVIVVGTLAHAFGSEAEIVETASQWVVAIGLAWAAAGLWVALPWPTTRTSGTRAAEPMRTADSARG